MEITYPLSSFGDFVVVTYSVTVYCDDDGAHFPMYIYNGRILLRGEDTNKTDDELYPLVIEHFKTEYKKHNRITFDEQMEDEAFQSISITIAKEKHYAKQIKITR